MDPLADLYDKVTSTPLGALVVFALIYLSRLAIDEWRRQQDRPAHRKPKKPKGA